MGASVDLAALRERVRDALDMMRVASFDGLKLRKTGTNTWSGECPFHAEKTGSFVVGGAGWKRGRYHCFGCGEDGDIFDYWCKRRNVDHFEAVKQLAGLGGVYVGEITFDRPKAGAERQPEKRLDVERSGLKKPSLPSLQKPSRAACELIARGRGLDVDAVWVAARVFGRVGYCRWPQYESHGKWRERSDGAYPSWAAIDKTRFVAEYRRMELDETGRPLPYVRQDGGTIKAWSTAGKNWPLGALEAPDKKRVLLVEGGPDMLAAYHFLLRHKMANQVAVVCMLGAGNRIRESALKLFAGCRVRIMVDADLPKDHEDPKKRKLPGMEAAARWQRQLQDAGAAVETFNVGPIWEPESVAAWGRGEIAGAEMEVRVPGLVAPDGSAVGDLNDLAKCGDEVCWGDDVRQAMRVWDF